MSIDTRIIKDLHVSDKDKGIEASGHQRLLIEDCTVEDCRVGLDILGNEEVIIRNVTIIPGPRTDTRFAYGIAFGNSGVPADGNGSILVENLDVGVLGPPSNDYGTYNRDGITLEEYNGLLTVRNSIFRGATDACIDAKSPVHVEDTIFGPSYQQLRVWPTASTATLRRVGFMLGGPTPGGTQTIWRHTDWTGTLDTEGCYVPLDDDDWPAVGATGVVVGG